MTDLELAIQWNESLCFNLSKQEERELARLIAGVRREAREAKYTEEDLEHLKRELGYTDEWLDKFAEYIRRETREATIRECLRLVQRADGFGDAYRDIEDLLRPPSAPAGPKCKVCGQVESDHGPGRNVLADFEPEEPGT